MNNQEQSRTCGMDLRNHVTVIMGTVRPISVEWPKGCNNALHTWRFLEGCFCSEYHRSRMQLELTALANFGRRALSPVIP